MDLKILHNFDKYRIVSYNIANAINIYFVTLVWGENAMADIYIEKCKPSDGQSISQICYRTGYMGEDLSGMGIFDDKVLFSYIFSDYYPLYEIENCFVAIDKSTDNSVVGYIIGTMDSARQLRCYVSRHSWKIIRRIIFCTCWKYPESFRTVCFMAANGLMHRNKGVSQEEFPAHFHINILPEYQNAGIGSKLINAFEEHIAEAGIKGIHLTTSNMNYKAVPFYESRGYSLAYEGKSKVWAKVDNYKTMIFVKKLN